MITEKQDASRKMNFIMADSNQLNILRQGVDIWNAWRRKNISSEIDLERANLIGANLDEVNLGGVNLQGANLREAKLKRSNLRQANLSGADLTEADLLESNLAGACLNDANLCRSWLHGAVFNHTSLIRADFLDAWTGETVFANTDLSQVLNLNKTQFSGPSIVGEDTIAQSKGKIPLVFLRGCGLNDIQIETAKLFSISITNEEIVKIQYQIYDLRATHALQISPLFISYSHRDSPFVDTLDLALTRQGVRFWRDIHDATAGRLETQIDLAIRHNPIVLLVLSKNSLNSDWVQHEVRRARELEKELGRDVLCPIALDESWIASVWPQRIMEQIKEYNILDFSDWKKNAIFETKFAKLLSGLNLFYKTSERD